MKRFGKRIVAFLCMMALTIGLCATAAAAFAAEELPEGLEEDSVAVTIASHSATCDQAGAFLLDSTFRDRRNAMSTNCNYTNIQNLEFNGTPLKNWILFNGEPINFSVHMRTENLDFYSLPSANEGDTIEFLEGMPIPYAVDNTSGAVISGHPSWPTAGTYTVKWKDYLGEGYKVQRVDGAWVKVAEAGSENTVTSVSAVTLQEATEIDPALFTFRINFELSVVDAETYDLEDVAAYADNISINGKTVAAINAEQAGTVTLSAFQNVLTVSVAAESALISEGESFELKIGQDFVSSTGMIMTADYVRYYLPELAYWSTVAPSEPVKTEPLRFASGNDFEMIDNGVNGSFDFNFATEIADQQYLAYNFHPEYLATLPPAYQSTKDAASELAAGGYLASLLEHVEINGKTIAQMWAENVDASAEFKSSMYQIHILGSTLSIRAANSTFNESTDTTIVLKAGLVFYKGKYLENDIKVVYTAADQTTVYTVDATAVELSADKTELEVGETAQLTAVVTPVDATAAVVYTSSDETVATVDETGLVTALKAGEVTITATAGGVSDTVTITVNAPAIPATGVELSSDKTTLKVGETAQLTAVVSPEGATDAVTYTSSDETVATVDESGKVTALKAGEVTITATAGEASDTVTITVEEASSGDDNRRGCNSSAAGGTAVLSVLALAAAVLAVRKAKRA